MGLDVITRLSINKKPKTWALQYMKQMWKEQPMRKEKPRSIWSCGNQEKNFLREGGDPMLMRE